MLPVKSIPYVVVPARFAGGRRRGDGYLGGGGGARLAGSSIYAGALHRSPSKNPPFPSSGGAAVLCLARPADGVGDDHPNNKKVCAFTDAKDAEAAPAGGGGGGDQTAIHDLAPSYLQELKRVFLLRLFKISSWGLILCLGYSVVYVTVKNLLVKYLNGDVVYAHLYAFIKKLVVAAMKDQEIREVVSATIIDIVPRSLEPINPVLQFRELSQVRFCCYCGFIYLLWHYYLKK
ncbi:uncharacterized protein LOC120701492 [Panicum virgatum]|uniref:Uncharacterized protein n=1 Tax=Panicum virgatum TaxID=38727 RepID=A0A8T0V7Q4_PANVG|nr:uncharacterized protein LOC120701492 [Panicum virgatum]KAG2628883.1 hypothetical protein PVAP13_3KG562900 [Panicum virgatum]